MDLTYTVVIQKKNMNDRLGIVVGRNMEKNDGGRVVLGFRCDSIAKKLVLIMEFFYFYSYGVLLVSIDVEGLELSTLEMKF